MKIAVITRWYNEEFFAPFFLNHYSWADEIIVLLERATTDRSAEIIARYPHARIQWCNTGDKLNDRLLSDMMSDLAAELDADWVLRADADEYAFAPGMACPRRAIEMADGNVINAWYRWIYRHHDEADLDPALPPVPQRRHGGVYSIWPGMGDKYLKPTIVRPQVKLRWYPGEQRYQPNPAIKISTTVFDGAHWQMVDCEHAIARNHKNESRLSEENIKNKWGVKNFTPEMIRAECARHLHDPRVI